MGCWNETCMGTNLPILYGEKCTVIFMIESPYEQSGCYAANQYMPILALHGTYDDYGTIDKIINPEAIELLNLLDIVVLDDHRQPQIYQNEKGIQGLISDAASGNLFVRPKRNAVTSDAKPVTALRAVFLKNSFVDAAMQYGSEAYEERYRLTLGHITDDMDEYFLFGAMRDLMLYVMSSSKPNPTVRWFFCDAFKRDKETAASNLKTVCVLNGFLDELRKAWYVPSGSGSQESLCEAQKLFLELYQTERLSMELCQSELDYDYED